MLMSCKNTSDNSPFTSLGMSVNFATGHKVHWTIDSTFTESPKNFVLQAAETPDFSSLLWEKPVGDSFFGIDNTDYKQSWNDNTRYRVKLETSKGVYYSPVLDFGKSQEERRKYGQSAEIQRKELLRMQYTGEDVWLLKRRTVGQVDWDAVDEVDGTPTSYQNASLGTSWKQGFYNPLGFRLSVEDCQQQKQLTSPGVREDVIKAIRTIGFPIIGERDFVVFANDERYSVVNVKQVYFPGSDICVVQTGALQLVTPSDPIYKMAMPERNI